MPIIGYMKSPYQEKFGIPRQPNLVQVESYIEMVGNLITIYWLSKGLMILVIFG